LTLAVVEFIKVSAITVLFFHLRGDSAPCAPFCFVEGVEAAKVP
jgi:hypothetical protein